MTIDIEEPMKALPFAQLVPHLVQVGRDFSSRGWVLGTSGNLSAVVSQTPLRLAITRSGVDKGALTHEHFLLLNANGKTEGGNGRPSAEALLHLAIVRSRGANAVMHTHSVWSTLISETYASDGGVSIEDYEMLKGLDGIRTHNHREWIPIIENSQEYERLSQSLEETLERFPDAHGVLLRRHGLYTWGRDVAEAKRHVEILEFLLEIVGRTRPL